MKTITKYIDFVVKKGYELAVDLHIYDNTRPFTKQLIGKKHLIGVEVGVQYGKNSLSMLKNLDIKMLYGVDPYVLYNEYNGIWFNHSQTSFDDCQKEAYHRLLPYTNHFQFIKKFSMDAVDFVPDNLDFVYIDGNHAYDYVKQDINLWYPKVREGGIIGGHDFFDMDENRSVSKAVIEFAVNNDLDLYFKNPDWWAYK